MARSGRQSSQLKSPSCALLKAARLRSWRSGLFSLLPFSWTARARQGPACLSHLRWHLPHDPVTLWPSQTQHHEPCDLGYLGKLPNPPSPHTQPLVSPRQGEISRPDHVTRLRIPGLAGGAGDPQRFSLSTPWLLHLPANSPLASVRAWEGHQAHPSSNPGHGGIAVWPWATLLSSLTLGLLNQNTRIVTTSQEEQQCLPM